MEGPIPCARKMHFSLLEEDNQEEHQDFITCPMTMCAFTRHVSRAPDYFMFPEGMLHKTFMSVDPTGRSPAL